MPCCKNCTERGVECEYSKPSRKGRKIDPQYITLKNKENLLTPEELLGSSPITNTPATIHPSSLERLEQHAHLNCQQVLDMYYYALCMFPQVCAIERPELEHHAQTFDLDNPIFILYITIRSLAEQMCAMPESAEESMCVARNAVGNMFFDHSNMYVAVSYMYLSLYESGCGRLINARFYKEFVKFHINQHANEKYLKPFRKMFILTDMSTDDDDNLLSGIARWPFTFKITNFPAPEQTLRVLTQEVNSSNFVSIMKIIDMVVDTVRNMDKNTLETRSLTLQDITVTTYFNGLKMAILKKVCLNQPEIEKLALAITSTTEHELFSFAPTVLVPIVAEATKIHLSIVQSIMAGKRMNPSRCLIDVSTGGQVSILVDYFDILRKDLSALQVLSNKFSRVKLFHSSLMNQVENILNCNFTNDATNDRFPTSSMTI